MDRREGERFDLGIRVVLLGVVDKFGGEIYFWERGVKKRVFGKVLKGVLGGKGKNGNRV